MKSKEIVATRQSLRAAINAMCRQCIYDPNGSGTWRQQVEACTSPNCPLYSVRPVQMRERKQEQPMPISYRALSNDTLTLLAESGDVQALMELDHRAERSLRAAINVMCRQCIYDPNSSGTWRQQVEACTSLDCPLYPLRPRSKGRRAAAEIRRRTKLVNESTQAPSTQNRQSKTTSR